MKKKERKEDYMKMSLNDKRAKNLASVIGSKACDRILELLSENPELSEKDIANELKMPINTVEYNLKNLLGAHLIEKSSSFFWSPKGRKIALYKLSNKSILISPRDFSLSSKLKTILPVSLLAGIGALAVRLTHPAFSSVKEFGNIEQEVALYAAENAADMAGGAVKTFSNAQIPELINTTDVSLGSPMWWFIGGMILAVAVYSIIQSTMKFTNVKTSKNTLEKHRDTREDKK